MEIKVKNKEFIFRDGRTYRFSIFLYDTSSAFSHTTYKIIVSKRITIPFFKYSYFKILNKETPLLLSISINKNFANDSKYTMNKINDLISDFLSKYNNEPGDNSLNRIIDEHFDGFIGIDDCDKETFTRMNTIKDIIK